jgi:hypothetical protein
MSAKSPHKAILNVNVKVYEVRPDGTCGQEISREDMDNVNVKPDFLLNVDGFDRFDCLKRLKKEIEEFGNG